MKLFFTILLFVCSGIVVAQPSQDFQLAFEYLGNGEYAKAEPLFEKLYSKNSSDITIYKGYLQCFEGEQKYADAEKLVKKQIKKNPGQTALLVDLGLVYKAWKKENDAAAQFDKATKSLNDNPALVNSVADAFNRAGLSDYAIMVYESGMKIPGAQGMFEMPLAAAYLGNKDFVKASGVLIALAENFPGNIPDVQGYIQELIQDPLFANEFTAQLYKRIQVNSSAMGLPDLLIWVYVQRKDFEMALMQTKALDKRNHENGSRVFQMAQSAMAEAQYDAAADAYQYIISEKGRNSPLFMSARKELLTVLRTKITVNGTYTPQELLTLKNDYKQFLNEFGKNGMNISVLRDLASLEANYLHEIDSAIALLEDAVELTNAPAMQIANCKLDLGDDYLMRGDQWDAMIYYGQVDKAFGDAPIGEEARFKNAKLSYFTADFEWAQAQMDILKGATTEMISNDAIALSVFITDNLGLDTTPVAMTMWARADLLFIQNRFAESVNVLDSIHLLFPNHELSDDIIFRKAEIAMLKHDFSTAADLFSKVDENYSTDLLGDEALFRLAELYQNQLANKEKAKDLYKQILEKYKGSIFLIEARKRYRDLRGDGPGVN